MHGIVINRFSICGEDDGEDPRCGRRARAPGPSRGRARYLGVPGEERSQRGGSPRNASLGVFDAALIDIRMPDMTGLDLLREIKRRDTSAEVVMMTGYPAISSAIEALREGAYDYLSKPLVLEELQHLMARLLERRFLRGEVSGLRVRLRRRADPARAGGRFAPHAAAEGHHREGRAHRTAPC